MTAGEEGPAAEDGGGRAPSDGDRSGLQRFFVNADEGRFRAGWRLLVAAVVAGIALVAGQVGILLAFAIGPDAGVVGAVVVVLGWWTLYALPTGAFVGLARYVDRRYVRDLGLGGPGWWRNLAFGLGLGVAMTTSVFAVEYAAGLVAVEGTLVSNPGPSLGASQLGEFGQSVDPGVPIAVALLAALAVHLAVGLFEELMVRGYLMTNLAEGLRGAAPGGARGAIAIAAVLTSMLFGVLHASNPGASLASAVNITAVGLFLAWTYVVTDDLGIAVGVHATWNFSLGSLWGFPVSGTGSPATVVAVRQTGDPLLTGGQFGPEAGLVVYVGVAVGVGLTWAWVRWTGGSVGFPVDVAVPDLRGEPDGNRER